MLSALLARSRTRVVVSLVAGTAAGMGLESVGWPWWAALPAAIIITVVAFMIIVALLYAHAKRSQPQRAAKLRATMIRRPEYTAPPKVDASG